jgi:hypothetical protein
MVSLSVCCALMGVVLGLRFKVLVLVPATAISLALIMGIALIAGAGLLWAVIFAIIGTVSLQFGYLSGLTIGAVIAASDLGAPRAPAADPRSAHS